MKYHFAAIEDNIPEGCLYRVKPLYILASFYYLKKLKEENLNKLFEYINSDHCKHFILDSGAFTFIMGSKREKDYILNNLDTYIKDYASFIKKYNIKNYIELDLDSIFGYSKVKEIRCKLESLVGYKSMPVFHNMYRNKRDLDEILNNYSYICISNFNGKKDKTILPQIKLIVDYANSKNVKVHGLALTGKAFTSQVKFYSVDSSSWRVGMKFGSIPTFDVKNHKIINKKISTKYRMKSGREVRDLIDEHCLREWKKYQLYLDRQ